MRRKQCATALLVLGAASWAAAEITETIESFEEAFVDGPIGKQPPGWTFFGYGPPAWTLAETGICTHGAQAFRYNLPIESIASTSGDYDGQSVIYKYTTIDALVRRPIDWTQPVTISIDVYANDTTVGGTWLTLLDFTLPRVDRSHMALEWGDNGVPNEQWRTLYIILDGTAQNQAAYLYPEVDFVVKPTDTGESAAIFDNLRVTYTPIPQPENCANGIDDDLDGLTDCEDIDDCTGDPACPCNLIVIFDTDFDGDVDQADFGFLQSCLTGPGDPGGIFDSLPEACQCLDISGPDRALDQQEVEAFEVCASGPAIPADSGCDD